MRLILDPPVSPVVEIRPALIVVCLQGHTSNSSSSVDIYKIIVTVTHMYKTATDHFENI